MESERIAKKNPAIAAVLAFVFGPLGLLYLAWELALAAFLMICGFWLLLFLLGFDALIDLWWPKYVITGMLAYKALTIISAAREQSGREPDPGDDEIGLGLTFAVHVMSDAMIGVAMGVAAVAGIHAAIRLMVSEGRILAGVAMLLIGTPLIVELTSFVFGLVAMGIDAVAFSGRVAVLRRRAISVPDSLNTLRRQAEKGDPSAQCELGFMYEEGNGVPQDYTEAVRWYREAANQGYGAAQHNLGVRYARGQGVPQDYVEAARWYREAGDQGITGSQYNLGLSYDTGRGVPQDYAEAARWFCKAAGQEDAEAQRNLGVRYARGQGVPQDYVEAHMWLNLAASRASGDDQKEYAEERDLVAEEMTPQQIAEAQRRAREWKPRRTSVKRPKRR